MRHDDGAQGFALKSPAGDGETKQWGEKFRNGYESRIGLERLRSSSERIIDSTPKTTYT